MKGDLNLNGENFISASRGAEITGYNKDYIGQLCRGGKVQSQMVGRAWYISEDAILKHKNFFKAKNASMVSFPSKISSEGNLGGQTLAKISSEGNLGGQAPKKSSITIETLPSVPSKLFSKLSGQALAKISSVGNLG
ncbi:MAG: hypothetical protein EXS59_00965, partial [Candidatus Taylorbacteria bacterium]|nr:hypothetical protein [Candidatus Taylorbacteria bacterium]